MSLARRINHWRTLYSLQLSVTEWRWWSSHCVLALSSSHCAAADAVSTQQLLLLLLTADGRAGAVVARAVDTQVDLHTATLLRQREMSCRSSVSRRTPFLHHTTTASQSLIQLSEAIAAAGRCHRLLCGSGSRVLQWLAYSMAVGHFFHSSQSYQKILYVCYPIPHMECVLPAWDIKSSVHVFNAFTTCLECIDSSMNTVAACREAHTHTACFCLGHIVTTQSVYLRTHQLGSLSWLPTAAQWYWTWYVTYLAELTSYYSNGSEKTLHRWETSFIRIRRVVPICTLIWYRPTWFLLFPIQN